MYATIETNNATHIIINIPMEGAERSLPALAAMLEQNSVFVQAGWSESKIVKPEMKIVLGDTFKIERSDEVIVIGDSTKVIDENFVIATPQAFTSNAAAMKREKDENSKLRNEISYLKQQVEDLKAAAAAMAEAE